jgi:cytosine/adenosine deaminase-related metal-dependent hydrolase
MILTDGRVAQSASKARKCDLKIDRGRVVALSSDSTSRIDAGGHIILPGLINAHDHLEFNLYPRLGHGPYPNSKAWADDIYVPHCDPVRQHLRVPKAVRLLWGGIKNLLSGVTTVCHHNRRDDPTLDNDFPVRVLKRFGWAHSLEFSPDVRQRYLATPKSWPFILHLGEATDAQGREEIFKLHAMGVLGPSTVLVHAVALDKKGAALVRQRGGSLIWCPSSNLFLLGRTLTARVLQSGLPVALGTDSALTAEGDLLDELKVGRRTARLDCPTLYRMVTESPRALLRLPEGYGALEPGSPSDVAVFRDLGLDPSETLLEAGPPEMVMVGGKVHLASVEFAERIPPAVVRRMFRFRAAGREMFCSRDIGELYRKTAPILGTDFRLAGRKVAA